MPFLNNSNNLSIKCLKGFHNFLILINFHNIIIVKDGNIIALLSGEIKNNEYKSPAGASFGGFILKHISYDRIENIVSTFIEYCTRLGLEKIIFTIPPLIYNNRMTQDL